MSGVAASLEVENVAGAIEVWKNCIEQRTGVRITPDREQVLLALVNQRMQSLEYEGFEHYLARSLCPSDGVAEWAGIVDALLVNETSFFRHKPSMDYVRRQVMTMVREDQLQGTFWAWSLGCSTGEEAYSLAITIDQAMQATGADTNFGVVATDISRTSILQARRGMFRESRMQVLSEAVREQYFDQVAKHLWRAKPNLRRKVCFVNGNALTDSAPLQRDRLQLIFCQNMLIYFRRWKRREIVSRLSERLDKHGSLVLGVGEINSWVPRGFIRVQPRSVLAYVRQSRD